MGEADRTPVFSHGSNVEYQVKSVERPDRANNQSNITGPFPGMVPMNASRPSERIMPIVMRGRPCRSMYVNQLGAWPISASACNVRDAP